MELSEKLHGTRQEQVVSPDPKPTPLPKVPKQPETQVSPKPEMSAVAAAYSKLHKIYKELVRHNETIFAAEKERNALEEKQGSLKGLSKLTKKGEFQSEIDRINERIDLLKVGLSGIARRYGYQTVQDFYRAYHAAKNAYADYQEKATKWEENYGSKSKRGSLHKRIKNYPKEVAERQSKTQYRKKTEG